MKLFFWFPLRLKSSLLCCIGEKSLGFSLCLLLSSELTIFHILHACHGYNISNLFDALHVFQIFQIFHIFTFSHILYFDIFHIFIYSIFNSIMEGCPSELAAFSGAPGL